MPSTMPGMPAAMPGMPGAAATANPFGAAAVNTASMTPEQQQQWQVYYQQVYAQYYQQYRMKIRYVGKTQFGEEANRGVLRIFWGFFRRFNFV